MVFSDAQLETLYEEKDKRAIGPVQVTPITARLAPPGTYRVRFAFPPKGPFLLDPAGELKPERA